MNSGIMIIVQWEESSLSLPLTSHEKDSRKRGVKLRVKGSKESSFVEKEE